MLKSNSLHQKIHPVDIHVGLKLKKARKANRMSQSDVAKLLGISFQQIQKYEAASNRISASRLFELARTLGVPTDYFFGDLADQVPSQENFEDTEIARAVSDIEDSKVKERIYNFIDVVSGKTVLSQPSR